MEVGELIEKLKKYPPYLEVYLYIKGCPYNVVCEEIEDDDINVDGCIHLTGE